MPARWGWTVGMMMGVALLAPSLGQVAMATQCPIGEMEEMLPAGSGEDLEVTGPCVVGPGTYHYDNVNVYDGGTLRFTDADIDFWATSILVEADSALTAGTPDAPIGTNGTLTIHLYGPDRGAQPFGVEGMGGQGIVCKTAGGTCGVPADIWNSNGAEKKSLPGGVTDYFYAYGTMPYDDGGTTKGFFGYKVLAVGYDGTIAMYGRKGASYGTLEPTDSGKSWRRLDGTVQTGAPSIKVEGAVDWQAGDEIVITTTDYLPGHSEQRTISEVNADGSFTLDTPLEHAHNGDRFPLALLPERLGIDLDYAETRAAVALLSRSIRIVSAGATFGSEFTEAPGNFIGGHTLVRAGVRKYQLQGVELKQLGQGGRLGHYPIHFHMARQVPAETFVKDCSVNESMTRWYVVHATQDVTLERNVGWKSIGHGYYIEDGTEIRNRYHANIGVFARAAVDNVQNPRQVPGILTSPGDFDVERVPFNSDVDHPSVFWIMNGYNDFIGNMAAGASACGTCYWLVPGATSGPSRTQKWESYAAMQLSTPGTFNRAATTPLKRFEGNFCSTAMNSFNVVGNTTACLGVGGPPAIALQPVKNTLSPAWDSALAASYYPRVDPGGGRFPTLCQDTDADCGAVDLCANGHQDRCAVTVIDRYTSAFHWAQTNFAAVWLRPQWYLYTNSVLSDVQNGGLTFVTGGDYTKASTIGGHWAHARKSVFIGSTQPDNPFASAASPFNPASGLLCDTNEGNNCLSRAEGVAFPLDNFSVNQRLFSIYDGPATQDSNAYLDITPTPIDGCDLANGVCPNSKWMYGRGLGIPKRGQSCYLPNAAIAWKQPNGFYYPPAFRSRNLFFDTVDIRHFVVEPSFLPGTFQTDPQAVKSRYCTWSPTMFTGFTDIDRQTVLNDDDGSLTGLAETTSVNEDEFFSAPVETVECASDITARTSPYDYVSTVVYPRCAAKGTCDESVWNEVCTTRSCYGVPLYRQYLTKTERQSNGSHPVTPSIRLMGEAMWQRNSLTVNHGKYYIDTTVSAARQRKGIAPDITTPSYTVFQAGQTYYAFLLFAKPTTRQTYQMYVGANADFVPTRDLGVVRASIASSPLVFDPDLPAGNWPASWPAPDYDAKTGILTVTVDMAAFAADFESAREGACKPPSFCAWQSGACTCSITDTTDPFYAECHANDSEVCQAAVRDVDCPAGGCIGFAVTLPGTFGTDPAKEPRPDAEPFPTNADWDVAWKDAPAELAGSCAAPLKAAIFGTSGNDRLRGTKGADLIVGGGGRDRILGKGGDDEIYGGPGDDFIDGGPGNDVIDGGGGDDAMRGRKGNDALHGGDGNDKAFGHAGQNTCTGAEKTRDCP